MLLEVTAAVTSRPEQSVQIVSNKAFSTTSIIEMNLGIIAASMPALPPFFSPRAESFTSPKVILNGACSTDLTHHMSLGSVSHPRSLLARIQMGSASSLSKLDSGLNYRTSPKYGHT